MLRGFVDKRFDLVMMVVVVVVAFFVVVVDVCGKVRRKTILNKWLEFVPLMKMFGIARVAIVPIFVSLGDPVAVVEVA